METLKDRRKPKTDGDFLMAALVLGLSLFGIVMVFSASYYTSLSKYGTAYEYLKQDAVWMFVGWIAFLIFSRIDYHLLKILAWPALIGGIILLGLLFTPLGVTINNATRWLNFGFATLMPGEVIKFSLIIWIATYLGDDPEKIKRIKDGLAPITIILAIVLVLIVKQPNMSTAGIIAILVVGMMFVAGMRLYWLVFLVGGGLAAFVAVILSPKGAYMLQRVTTALDPFADELGSGYQVVQSLLALGSGGVTGVGLGRSIQKALYLPEPMNDFITAIIGEELGLIGLLIMLIAFMLLIWRCCRIALRAKDYYGMLLASGITILLGTQVILNVAVVSASFFPTGVVLPFITLGGNATLIFLSLMGILFNISKQPSEGVVS
ncbi:MAG: cell division protein FtsW [Firmicutes bacterium]|nr:cell division protein FtsW [Bacillota bacterium]